MFRILILFICFLNLFIYGCGNNHKIDKGDIFYYRHHSGSVNTKKEGLKTNCFGHEEECGYPGTESAGVEKGKTLTEHLGNLVVSTEGQVVKEMVIKGNLEIKANNVIIENDEVISYSQKRDCEKGEPSEGSGAVQVQQHGSEISTGIVIRHITVHGVTQGCPESLGNGISIRQESSAADVKIEWTKVYWTGQCFQYSAWYENNYCNDNGSIPANGSQGQAHYDGIFAQGQGCSRPSPCLVIRHNTILVPHWQTATMNLGSAVLEIGEELIEENLLAGGGYLIYPPSHPEPPLVRGPVYFKNNRYARCLGKEYSSKAGGHRLCEGLPEENEITEAPLESDGHGFFPNGGSYGVIYPIFNAEKIIRSGNYWDNNLEAAP